MEVVDIRGAVVLLSHFSKMRVAIFWTTPLGFVGKEAVPAFTVIASLGWKKACFRLNILGKLLLDFFQTYGLRKKKPPPSEAGPYSITCCASSNAARRRV